MRDLCYKTIWRNCKFLPKLKKQKWVILPISNPCFKSIIQLENRFLIPLVRVHESLSTTFFYFILFRKLIFPPQMFITLTTMVWCQNFQELGPPQLSGFVCAFQPAVQHSNPKHTIFKIKFCTSFVIVGIEKKDENKQKDAGWGPFKKIENLNPSGRETSSPHMIEFFLKWLRPK